MSDDRVCSFLPSSSFVAVLDSDLQLLPVAQCIRGGSDLMILVHEGLHTGVVCTGLSVPVDSSVHLVIEGLLMKQLQGCLRFRDFFLTPSLSIERPIEF